MILTKIISGGQTGADRGGLIAAKEFKLQTGGWMPKGFLAQDGRHPGFAALYSIQESESEKYPPRTFKNAKESDATIRIAVDFNSSGELCTLKAIKQYKKPYLDIGLDSNPLELVEFIVDNNISVLNVAGNSERTAKGIQEYTIAFLSEAFKILMANNQLTQIEYEPVRKPVV